MKLNKWKALGLTAFMALALVACNAEEESSEKEKEATATKTEQVEKEAKHNHAETATARFVVSSDKAVHILDDKFQQIEQFDIGSGAFSVVDSGRYVFVRDAENKDSYTLLDSGFYVEDHADHMHPYEDKPAIAKNEVEAASPAHMISHAGRTAIFNDGSGKVDVYENDTLATDTYKPAFVYEGAPHHGAAVPLSTGELAVTVLAKEGDALPTGVKIVGKDGKETATVTNSCEGLHGTAYSGEGDNEKLAFGCIGKAVVYDVAGKKATDVVLPDKEARIGTVMLGANSDYIFTNYSIENEPQNKVGVINAKTGDFKLVELPATYKSATLVAPDNKGYVLTEDGNLYKIDLQKAEIELTVPAFNPFNLEEEAPALFMANEIVYVAMPSYQKIYAVHGDHVHESAKLDFVPTAFAALSVK